MNKNQSRTQKEKDEAKLAGNVAGAFNSLYKDYFGIYDKVIFAIYDKLKERERYIDISYSSVENCYQVDINPDLADESKLTIEQNGKRAALKLLLIKKNLPAKDSSEPYRKLANLFHIWLYSRIFKDKNGKLHTIDYPETPHKWHVYSCSVCAKPMLAYLKKLPNNFPINSMSTVWHKKNSRNESEKPHQGKYAYKGLVELKNWELQEIKFRMQKIINEHDGGKDTAPRYYYNDF